MHCCDIERGRSVCVDLDVGCCEGIKIIVPGSSIVKIYLLGDAPCGLEKCQE